MQKTVASRLEEVTLPHNFSPLKLWEQLGKLYESAFVSLVSIPNLGTWIGATPETLLKVSPDKIYTVSLAGTRVYNSENPISQIKWGDKETKEQELVSDSSEKVFQKLVIPLLNTLPKLLELVT